MRVSILSIYLLFTYIVRVWMCVECQTYNINFISSFIALFAVLFFRILSFKLFAHVINLVDSVDSVNMKTNIQKNDVFFIQWITVFERKID